MNFEFQVNLVASSIEGVLDRKPAEGEVEAWITAFNGNVNLTQLIHSLRLSAEYLHRSGAKLQSALQVLPNKQLLFVHIPKTAGSAFRSTIERLSGFPFAYIGRKEKTNPAFFSVAHLGKPNEFVEWPYQTGHQPIAAFPPKYPVLSFVREPVARLLSIYAFVSKNVLKENPGAKVPEFSNWVVRMTQPSDKLKGFPRNSFAENFMAPQAFFLQERYVSLDSFLKLTLEQQMELVTASVPLIDFIGWSHSMKDQSAAVRFATGISTCGLDEVNLGVVSKLTEINAESMERLNQLALLDTFLISELVNAGKLRRPSPNELTTHRNDTLVRLGFVSSP